MKAGYMFLSLLASFQATASPLGGSDINIYGSKPNQGPSRAPDPPPAPTPLPLSPNGILPDGSVINYTPNNPSNRQHSCWTVPKSIPPPSNKYQNGTCTVCVVQRNGTEKGSDYQLWARDNDNNAMGDMKAETVWPVDAQQPNTSVAVTLLMGGSFLTIAPELSSYDPRISHVTLEWKNAATQIVDFDYAAPHFGDNCTDAGNALNGAVRYVTCFFDC